MTISDWYGKTIWTPEQGNILGVFVADSFAMFATNFNKMHIEMVAK
jgi:hypothetical protein